MKQTLILLTISLLIPLNVWCAVGDSFTAKTIEGCTITYEVMSEADKTCRVKGHVNNIKGGITIPGTVNGYAVKEIGCGAFYSCKELTYIILPENVNYVRTTAFKDDTALQSITINTRGKIRFEEYDALDRATAFMGCSALKSVTIGPNVTWISGKAIFMECEALSEIHISDIASWCKMNYVYGDNPLHYAHNLYLNDKIVNDVVIPASVESISSKAFDGCTCLKTLTIEDGIKQISASAFKNCSNLKTVYFPPSITTIGNGAFYGCENLRKVNIKDVAAWCNIDFSNMRSNPLYYAHRLYLNNKELRKLSIPKGFTKISNFAFLNCESIETVSIPGSIKALWSKTDPSPRVSSNHDTFINCSNLSDLYCAAISVPDATGGVFTTTDIRNAVLHVPAIVINDYRKQSPWNSFGNIVALKEGDPGYDELDHVTLTAKNYVRVYGEDNPTFDYTISNGTITTGEPIITCSATKNSPVGTYEINITKGTVSNNGTVSLEKGLLTITKAPLTISAGNYTKVVGEDNPTFTPTYSGFKNNETKSVLTKQPIVTTTATKTSPVGSYPVTISGAEAQNYEISYKNGTLTVQKKAVLTAKSYTRQYGDENPTFGYSVTGEAIDSGTPTITCSATNTSPVGTYDIVIAKGTVSNRSVELVKGTLTITKAPLVVTAGAYKKKQGEENPEFTLTYDGFKNNETETVLTKKPTATCAATTTSEPGEYEVTVGGGESQNYELSYTKGKLTVMEADPVTVTANSYTREYGEENPTFEYTSSGVALAGVPVISCEATATSPVGTYPIVIKKGIVTNYNDSYVNGTLIITKAPLTVTVANAKREQGVENPEFVLNYEGWKLQDSESVLLKKPIATSIATKDSPAGDYNIVINGGEAENYELNYVNGKLTVTVPSSINDVINGQSTMDNWYDLSGRKLNQGRKAKGVYIVNGKKRVIK